MVIGVKLLVRRTSQMEVSAELCPIYRHHDIINNSSEQFVHYNTTYN